MTEPITFDGTYTIRQLVPAPGWFAVLLWEGATGFDLWSLVAWALVENTDAEGTTQGVIGLIAQEYTFNAESLDRFYAYVHEKDITSEREAHWRKMAQAWQAKKAHEDE